MCWSCWSPSSCARWCWTIHVYSALLFVHKKTWILYVNVEGFGRLKSLIRRYWLKTFLLVATLATRRALCLSIEPSAYPLPRYLLTSRNCSWVGVYCGNRFRFLLTWWLQLSSGCIVSMYEQLEMHKQMLNHVDYGLCQFFVGKYGEARSSRIPWTMDSFLC